jgi:hypothetical protein
MFQLSVDLYARNAGPWDAMGFKASQQNATKRSLSTSQFVCFVSLRSKASKACDSGCRLRHAKQKHEGKK